MNLKELSGGNWEQADAIFKAACRIGDDAREQAAKAKAATAPSVSDAIASVLTKSRSRVERANLLPDFVAASQDVRKSSAPTADLRSDHSARVRKLREEGLPAQDDLDSRIKKRRRAMLEGETA